MRTVQVHVEAGVGIAADSGVAAWAFEVELWGVCGQGADERAALDDLRCQVDDDVRLEVAERIHGDEQAFARDRAPCTDAERKTTLEILASCRCETLALVRSCPSVVLDWDDPSRVLPSYARWRTIRQLAWHVVDTESRYYLPGLGLGYRPRTEVLPVELVESAAHVRATVEAMPSDLVRTVDGEVWTSVKLLRRLAWHERGELVVMKTLAARARARRDRA
ncbi:MAG TPA: hypothetical protein VE287_00775 [Actinopolymorphaceae bacterium]|nr:hypothetical protein [Actinopolymorphaceae bacterium]